MAPPKAGSSQADLSHSSVELGRRLAHPEPDDEVVITGLSGTYPESMNVYEFRDNLMNKVDLVTGDNRRWKTFHSEIPSRGGRLYKIEKFDASFFGYHYKKAESADLMQRLLLEKTYEAIVDAGLHPTQLQGTRTGVFIGTCFTETEKAWVFDDFAPHAYGITGCHRSIIANSISNWLQVDGPSYIVDTACSSSLYALEHAYRALRMGDCDTAIVGGSNLCLHPHVTLQFARLGVLNKDGKCKCFDATADGYTRAEAIVVCVLQKSKDAKRIYSRLIHAKTNCDGYKEQGITYPSGSMQTVLLKEFYEECGVNPLEVDYVEAHGTGTKVGDPEEINGIASIFLGDSRKRPLMIGSVKSNIGHAEPVSGLCSVTKVILGMESDCLIPNINFNQPRDEMKALQDGRIKVVTETVKWHGGYVPISSFGFGGANCHVLLQSNQKLKVNHGIPKDDLPRLVQISGRSEDAIHSILDDLAQRPLDAEYIGLLHEVFKYDIPAHFYRGYGIFTKNELLFRDFSFYPYDKKPLWFVFSGLGSQWTSMGAGLMKIPLFSATIEKCHQILSRVGVNITDLLINTNENTLSNHSNSFVAVTAIQIAICDLLTAIGVVPTGIIGYSIGEIAAGYYDGCLSLEQALLVAFYLGQASDSSQTVPGTMISVKIQEGDIKEYITPGIEVACYNSERNFTLAGPIHKIQQLIIKLQENQVNYELIETKNTPFHTTYVKDIAPLVLKQLKTVIPNPKERSEKWISSAKQAMKLCSAECYSQLLVNPIIFEEVYDNIPDNSVNFEISPHGILQGFLKRSVFDDSINIAALQKNKDSCVSFLTAVGKLYMTGQNPRIERIYPAIQFPVSKGTPMLSPLIRWDHSHDWFVTKFEVQDKIKSGDRTVTVKLADDDSKYLSGHTIDGRILYPATGYLQLVWETISMFNGYIYQDTPIVFENVKFLRATNVPKEGRVHIKILVQKVSGMFEIIESGATIVSGKAYIPEDIEKERNIHAAPVPEQKDYYVGLNSRDIYKELRLRGYNYSGLFRGMHSCDPTATVGKVYWKDNWVAFMDTMLQLQILQLDTRGLFVPTRIQRLFIDAEKHKGIIDTLGDESTIPVYAYKNINAIVCGGVEIRGLDASAISRKKDLGVPVIETYQFIPNEIEATKYTLEQSVRLMLQVILENLQTYKVKTAESIEDEVIDERKLLSPIVQTVLGDLPLIQADINILTSNALELNGITVVDQKLNLETDCLLVIVQNILDRPQVLSNAFKALAKRGFVLSRESISANLSLIDHTKYQIVLNHPLDSERIILLAKLNDVQSKTFIDISESVENHFEWVPLLQDAIKTDPHTVVYSQGDDFNGIIGFVNCIRKEPGLDGVRAVFIMDKAAPKFNAHSEFYAQQLRKGLAMNILKDGKWGTYRHLLLGECKDVDAAHAFVNVTVRGDLSSLRWLEGGLSKETTLDGNRTLVNVYCSALNFRDIMTATGRIAPEVVAHGRFECECVQGLEYAGRLNDGRRVFGMMSHKAMATMTAADPLFMWYIPDNWTMEDAVTVPVVYGTVLFAFVLEGHIQPGMSVLIHAGSGGVGQAAINVALHYGCTVYTTVGTPEKREFIKKHWPEIKDNQIGNSRDCSFEQMVQIETNGRGVDLVLNSLAEEKLQASIRCLAAGGKFLEIGKFDLSNDNPLPLVMFEKGASFHGIMLDSFFNSASPLKGILNELVQQEINAGSVKPLHRHVFQTDEIEDAFRFMASGKHMGKVVIHIRDEEPEKVFEPTDIIMKVVPRYVPSETGVYIVTGGLGGFGLELVDWLILRGAKKLVLTSRKGITTGYQAYRIKIWRSYGLDLEVSTEDITTYEGCQRLIQHALNLGPVEAIFNLAVVLRDSLFENQTIDDFKMSFKPKADATKHLDTLSRMLCPNLRQFVIFSSVSCGRGNAGQTNYGMANSVMERICEQRKASGLPALAIEWGAVGDVGLVAELQEEHTELVIGGTLQQRIANCLSCMDQFLSQPEPIVASMVVAEKRTGDGASANIVEAVVNILGIRDIKTVSIHSTLAELGMDSIMAVEIKQTLEREFEVFLTPQDIRSMTFARLYEIAAERAINPTGTEIQAGAIEIPEMGKQFMLRTIGDEENSGEPFIILPSKVPVDCSDYIILIPGIEGVASVLATLASNLETKTVCLQLGFDTRGSTIEEMAQIMFERCAEYLTDSTKTFTIVAYSYGTVLALEIAAILESAGKFGRIILIDGAPEMLKTMTRQQIQSDVETDFQNGVLNIIASLVVEGDAAAFLKSTYEHLESWEEKVDTIVKNGPTVTHHSETHLKNIAESIYRRLKAIVAYKPTIGRLRSTIKLLKPKLPSVMNETEDYGLSAYSTQPVEVVYCEGNHVGIIDHIECANEINKLINGGKTVFKESLIDTTGDIIKSEALRT